VIHWVRKTFAELTLAGLYDLLALRQEVFTVEQTCAYQDCDYRDQDAEHVLASEDGTLVACARLIDAPEAMVAGRFATRSSHRSRGLGHELVRRCLARAAERFPHKPVTISAQQHLAAFYRGHGFVPTGDPYLEDGIPHIAMLYTPHPNRHNEG